MRRQSQFIQVNKSKGFTLIEILTVIFFVIVLSGIVLFSTNNIKKYENNIEEEALKNNILAFINNSKIFCRTNKTTGYIYFDTRKGIIKFQTGVRLMSSLTLPDQFALEDVITSSGVNKILIDNFGFTSDACTIKFLNKYGVEKKLTICVGTSYAEIK